MYPSLSRFISALDDAGELLRVKARFSPALEIPEIADRMVKNNGKAILFEDTGTAFPLLINAFASDRRMCMALGINDFDEVGRSMEHLLHELMMPRQGLVQRMKALPLVREVASWMPRSSRGKGECQECVMEKPDLSLLPVLTCWPYDGGPFITLPAVHTRDPETGARNLGMYRMQVFGPDKTGMHWHLHKDSAGHYQKYRKAGKRMPVTVTLGGDPVYTYAATAPLPAGIDEYLFAGFLRKKKVRLVRCLTNDLEVPSDVDFVIEGYVDPAEDPVMEGPFGDHTGFYSLPDKYPVFHVTCITHRKNAVYPATIVGIPPMEDGWIGKATERIFLTPMKYSLAPELTDIHMPAEGVFHNIVLASIHASYPGQAVKVMSALWGAGQMMFNKIMIVFEEGTDLRDYRKLLAMVCDRVDPVRDVHLIRGPVDVLDHASSRFAYGSKMGVDATGLPGSGRKNNEVSCLPLVMPQRFMLMDEAVKSVNASLVHAGLPLLILFVEKSYPGQIRILAEKLHAGGLLQDLCFVVFADKALSGHSLNDIVWATANHVDPVRDCFYPASQSGQQAPLLIIDGTSKSGNTDHFDREWPNVITMDNQTIHTIDLRWADLHAGSFVASPSLAYKDLVINEGAVAVIKNDG